MPSTWPSTLAIWGALLALPRRALASVDSSKFWGHIPEKLQSDHISFDPLGVAAILHNPRAIVSCSRLYTQWEAPLFWWPHTMMLGGVLIPFKRLGEHLLGSGEHPALEMYHQATSNIVVRTDTVFKTLPIDFGNMWAFDAISAPSSETPQFDVIVCTVPLEAPAHEMLPVGSSSHPPRMYMFKGLLALIAIGTALFLGVGLWFSIFSDDVWSMCLFGVYIAHWLSGLGVSVAHPLRRQRINIKEDSALRYAVYDRKGDRGMVVFTGTQRALEAWGRTSWIFADDSQPDDKTHPWTSWMSGPLACHTAHWSWTLSGSLCALASVACMVNMNTISQLVYLALLLASSLAEILATRTANSLRHLMYEYTAPGLIRVQGSNKTRTQAIIRATLGGSAEGAADPAKRLHHVRWRDQGLLPNMTCMNRLQELLDSLKPYEPAADEGKVRMLLEEFESNGKATDPKFTYLYKRFKEEVEATWGL